MSEQISSKTNSFSFVTEPDPRFVVDLPIRPATPSTDPSTPIDSGTNQIPSLTASTFMSSPATAVPQAPGYAPGAASNMAASTLGAPAGSPPAATSSLSSASASVIEPTARTRRSSSSSKSKNRLSVTLSGLLSKTRSKSTSRGAELGDGERTQQQRQHSGSVSRAGNAGARSSTSSASSSRRVSLEGPGADSRSPSPPSTSAVAQNSNGLLPTSPSKPPVSLPSLFRRRDSAHSITSAPNSSPPAPGTRTIPLEESRKSFERTRPATELGLSCSSFGSSDGALASDVSTAATSPDLDTAEVTIPREHLSSAEKRRRSSLVLARALSGRQEREEDLSDFVRASGATSPSPALSAGPFARRPSNAPTVLTSLRLPEESSDSTSPTMSSPDSTIASRRQTRNIENLSLGDLGSRSPTSPPSATLLLDRDEGAPPTLAEPLVPIPSATPIASVRPRSTTQARLQALPRLLSTNAIARPSVGAIESEQEQEQDDELDTDTEDLEGETEGEAENTTSATSDDEGDQYASADEAPVVSRTVTPAQTPRPASQQFTSEHFGHPSASTMSSNRLPSLVGLASPTLFGGRPSNSWVTFAPATPGTVRTARPQPASTETAEQSYFDLPRPAASSSTRTPGVPPQTPLAPMSISEVARGKRPALQEQVEAQEATHARMMSTPGLMQSATATNPQDEAAVRHGLYRLKSQSEVALMSPSMVDSDDEPLGTAAITGLDPIWRTAGGAKTPGPSFLSKPASPVTDKRPSPISIPQTPASPRTPRSPVTASSPTAASPTQTRLSARPNGPNGRLHRPRSMYELRDAPPAYTSIARQPGFGPRQDVQPREEEGREGLPQYTCAIHIEGFMPRKMEFTAPGVQAKDRAWKRQYVVLHGTSIKVYKYDLRTHPIPGEEDWSVVPVDIAGHDGPPPLHFHQGEYGVDASLHGSRFPLSIEDAKAKAKSRIIQQATASSTNLLLRHYSLQNAESGLAADYIKRKHVVRVRAEGEQFLLQAKDDRGVIDLIEALQAATNVALDLDARPLPKFITLPRRRRRRRPRPDATGATATAAAGSSDANGTGASSTTASATSQERRTSPDRFAQMADEDRALASGNDATIL
ncbi:uncharacterized protein JCM15063_005823 [Sporobolomyces koalae]|uniref:uncharacterized protein n=1 Tax=Sporobolomyces koalae TaxID=500713 RepID=UPI00317BDDBF